MAHQLTSHSSSRGSREACRGAHDIIAVGGYVTPTSSTPRTCSEGSCGHDSAIWTARAADCARFEPPTLGRAAALRQDDGRLRDGFLRDATRMRSRPVQCYGSGPAVGPGDASSGWKRGAIFTEGILSRSDRGL